MSNNNKCKHHRPVDLCPYCRYSKRITNHLSRHSKDTVDDIKMSVGYRLIRGFAMIRHSEG